MEKKNTLNLPNTKFPMRGKLSIKEPIRLKKWIKMEIYKKLRKNRKGCKKFILHDGPPYANGRIHIGHAVNKILKDIIIKSKNLEGYDSWYVPGWDCHGLPIEQKIEKNNKGKKLTSKKIIKYCRKYAERQIYSQKLDFIRLGILGDWDKAYRTMELINQAGIIRSLSVMVKKGYVFRGLKPVNWCFDCESALAESEVDYLEKKSEAIDVAFLSIDNYKLLKIFGINNKYIEKPIEVVIWTTTPWTIPANQALHVRADCIYALVDVCDRFIILAEKLVEKCLSRYKLKYFKGKIIAKTYGKDLEKIRFKHPLHKIDSFYDRITTIYIVNYIDIKTGTGIIHSAPAYGEEDFIAYSKLKYNENMLKLVKGNGFYIKSLPVFGGKLIWKANSEIIEKLKNSILAKEKIVHSYMHCWRHKKPLIKRATLQWFIGMDVGKKSIRKKALENIKKVKVYPNNGKKRLYNMISNRPDWCISRQRSWGVPIPFFVHRKTGLLHKNTIEIMEIIAKKVEKEGIEAWIKIKSCEILGNEAIEYKKVNDILDVWFDSGTTHYHVLRIKELLKKEERYCILPANSNIPADLYLEGLDQYRGWFHTSLITGAAIDGYAPYKELLSHGFTVDYKGRKMSKSIGNVISPQKIIKKYGADILRLWVVSNDYESEMTMSEEIIKRISDSYRRIRNTTRFMMANLRGFDPYKNIIVPEKMLALDRWALDRAAILQKRIKKAYKNYRFIEIYQQIYLFCTRDMGSFYLDIIKDRQYTTQKNSLYRRSCQTALYHIVEAMSRWITPICSFTAEEIYEKLPVKRYKSSILLETYYRKLITLPKDDMADDMGREFWEIIIAVKNEVNKCLEVYRNKKLIKSSLDANVTLYVNDTYYKLLSMLRGELRFVLITSSAYLKKDIKNKKSAIVTDLTGLQVLVEKSKYKKCERSWERLPDVGKDNSYLCDRSLANLPGGPGEVRLYV